VSPRRGALLVLFLGIAAYVNSLGNGFAYDDRGVVVENPVVREGSVREVFTSPYWPLPVERAGLYRPVTTLTFLLEWRLFGDDPRPFHAANVLLHATVSLLVFLLLLEFAAPTAAVVGAALFAVHPLHTEAVANVVGAGELLAALFYLAACLLYLRTREWRGPARGLRLLALGGLYLLSILSKEIGVTLPAALLLLEAGRARGRVRPLLRALREEAAVFVVLALGLLVALGARFLVLGTVRGDAPAPVFHDLATGERLLTAVALWPTYLRLLLLPLDLAADYAPGVLFPAPGVTPEVIVGGAVLLLLALAAVRGWRNRRLVSLGILWFAVVLLPVSNLLFPTGVLLAERTLYLPSVGLALAAAGLVPVVEELPVAGRRMATVLALLSLFALFTRTVLRNPSWYSTFTVEETLAREHPESYMAFRTRALGLLRVGEGEAAGEAFEMALRLAPNHYRLLTAAARYLEGGGEARRAVALLRRAVRIAPGHPGAYRLLAELYLRNGMGREAHRVAVEGLRAAGPDRGLWALLSEAYLTRGDLAGAVRAREAALGVDPAAEREWLRLAEILAAMGDSAGADRARSRAAALEEGDDRGGA